MKYRIFSQKAGLRVSELALGTGNFGTRWGHGASFEESRQIFDRYVKAGGNFIDTADNYQFGQAEEFLSQFILAERDQLVLASKYSLTSTAQSSLATTGNNRKNLIRSVETSLKRLKTDRLDILWAHFADGQTPVEEIVRGFDDLVRAGKIIYGGFSNFPAWRIANASLLADLRGWSPIIAIQVEYSLIQRDADRELLPMAQALGLGAALWSPLAGGLLTGKYRTKTDDPNTRKQALGVVIHDEKTEREKSIIDEVTAIATANNIKPLDVALAWVRRKIDALTSPAVTLIGPRTLAQLEDYLAALEKNITDEQLTRLDELSVIDLGYPHNLISKVQAGFFGASSSQIELKHPVA